MKHTILLVCLIFMGCLPSKNTSTIGTNDLEMKLTITKIRNEKDGQTLFMSDDKGGDFITVISFANGNWVEVDKGDIIILEAVEILESDPAQIISKNIRVVE